MDGKEEEGMGGNGKGAEKRADEITEDDTGGTGVGPGEGRRGGEDAIRTTPTTSTSSNASTSMIVEPFPTLYWLTSPILRMQVSEIEKSTSNGVSSMEDRLRSSFEHMRSMERAHESYGRR